MDMSLSMFWEMMKDKEACHAVVHGVAKSRMRLSDKQLMALGYIVHLFLHRVEMANLEW